MACGAGRTNVVSGSNWSSVSLYNQTVAAQTRFMCFFSEPSVGGNLLLSASSLQNECHFKSGILVI